MADLTVSANVDTFHGAGANFRRDARRVMDAASHSSANTFSAENEFTGQLFRTFATTTSTRWT